MGKEFINFCIMDNECSACQDPSFCFSINKSILQVLDRGEKIELLVDKTENLRSQVSKCISYCSTLKNTGNVF